MGVDRSVVGRSVRRQRVVVERGPVAAFARAVGSDSPVYQDARAAAEAGFDRVPAPPTFAFAAHHWGARPELQPDGEQPDPLMDVIAELRAEGGMILHGEQELTFTRPLAVGDELVAETTVTDVSEKAGKTFVVVETAYREPGGGDGAEPVATSRFTLVRRR